MFLQCLRTRKFGLDSAARVLHLLAPCRQAGIGWTSKASSAPLPKWPKTRVSHFAFALYSGGLGEYAECKQNARHSSFREPSAFMVLALGCGFGDWGSLLLALE